MADKMSSRCTSCSAALPAAASFCTSCGRPVQVIPDPHSGKVVLGKYHCRERVAMSPTTFVYKVQHAKLLVYRTMKVLRPEYRTEGRLVEAFWREARVAATLRHPNLVQLLDADTMPDATPCSLWEYVEGTPLARRQDNPLGSATSGLLRGFQVVLARL